MKVVERPLLSVARFAAPDTEPASMRYDCTVPEIGGYHDIVTVPTEPAPVSDRGAAGQPGPGITTPTTT